MSNLEKPLSIINKRKPFLSVIIGDFNARSSLRWPKDIDTTEGSKLFSLTPSNGFPQLINEPTHMKTNSSSWIDSICTNQKNLSVNPGVHALLHPNCHHQIIYSSFNLNISYNPLTSAQPSPHLPTHPPTHPPITPPYERLIWDYKKADSKNIQKALDSVYWSMLFDQKDINVQVI